MRTIQKLDAAHIDAWAKIATNAYPGMKINSAEEMAQLKERLEKGLAQTVTIQVPGTLFLSLLE